MKIIERNLQEIGKSLLVTLPKPWIDSLKLKKGSRIKMMVSEQGNLMIAPEFVKDSEKKEAVIDYDECFSKRFFRAYFQGCEKITITFRQDQPKIREFLNKFMNVQIIEETSSKLVIKIFKIEELSIEECLKRMFYLSLNMFDEAESKNKLKELKNSLIKFYYMLVMQIRRYLAEGKYTEENQIALLRATDCRMVAEKIEKISELLMNVKSGGQLKQIKIFYNNAFNYFFNSLFDKSLALLKEKKEFDKKIKDRDLILILGHAHEIGMIVK